MATAQPTRIPLPAPAKPESAARIWVIWIAISVAGSVVGALVAWRMRLLIVGGPSVAADLLRYLATIANAIVLSGAQWFFLRRYRLDVYWWVPVTVGAGLIAGIVVIPAVLRTVAPALGTASNVPLEMLGSALALGASGLVIGTAQALVLRQSVGKIALAWIPATVIGSALSGAATSSISEPLFGMAGPVFVSVSVLAGLGSLLIAVSQSPILIRLVR